MLIDARTPRFRTQIVRAALVVALAVFVWPAFAHAVEVWSTDTEFNYGFFVPPLAVGMLWWRRDALRRRIGRGHAAGLVIVALAIVLTLVGRRTGINVLAGLAVTPLLIGLAVYLWGWSAARVVAFPALFLVFGLGLYRGLLNSLGFVLQDVTATGAALAATALGLNLTRDGLILQSVATQPEYAFVVAQACSGMSSLLSLLTLSALLIYAMRGSIPAKSAVVLSVLPLVVVANTLRVTLVLVIASRFGQDAALGFFHGASSLILFGVAMYGMFVVSQVVRCKLPTFATAS